MHGLERSGVFPLWFYTILRNLHLILGLTHLFACMFFFITYHSYYSTFSNDELAALEIPAEEAEAASWFQLTPNDIIEWSARDLYLRSFYWSVTTFTTVGYGDFSPVTITEQVFVTVPFPPAVHRHANKIEFGALLGSAVLWCTVHVLHQAALAIHCGIFREHLLPLGWQNCQIIDFHVAASACIAPLAMCRHSLPL